MTEKKLNIGKKERDKDEGVKKKGRTQLRNWRNNKKSKEMNEEESKKKYVKSKNEAGK